ncbi:guanylate-binding protein 1-like [Pocillopora verrucosa]|uniref:guanylate-binding protein 1-like n=1 Tax=Pocillopora verrucosa TaxID=203993 RepID=UPI00334070F5
MASRKNQNIAIPLCLPNNCQWNAATGEYIKTEGQRTSLYVVEEALKKLRTVKGPVCVVSIAGPSRKGKSYVLSQAFDQPEVFPLGHCIDPETFGIWMWIVPQKMRDSAGRECTVVLLDSEGIDAVMGEGLDDTQIFTLIVLLASVLIYNSAGVPTRHDLNGLDFITKLSQRIRLRSNDGSVSASGPQLQREDKDVFHKTFPFFFWLLRDATQSLPPDCRNIKEYFLTRVFKGKVSPGVDHKTEEGVAESILRFFSGFDAFMLPAPTVDPEIMKSLNQKKSEVNDSFWSGLERFKSLLRDTLSPKRSFNDGEFVTGEGLAAMIQRYVDTLNAADAIPNVQSAWDAFVKDKCAEAVQSALRMYDAFMTARLSNELPCSNNAIRMCHNNALEQCKDLLMMELAGISTNSVETTAREFKSSLEKKLLTWLTENEDLTRHSCENLLVDLKKIYLDPVLEKLLGEEGGKVSFEDIIGGYQRVKDDFHQRAVGAENVIAAVFLKLYEDVLKEKEQYKKKLAQLKDFDKERSRELAIRACQEQERKRLEEEQARLQQENLEQKKQMEMLIRSLDKEKRRFADQMNGERQAHQDQIQNMMKASMRQAQVERQTFMRENEALQEQFLVFQERNEENMEMVQNLYYRAALQQKEREAFRQQVKDQADQEKVDLIKALNKKHDEEMKALRDELSAKLNEIAKQVPRDELRSGQTAQLIDERTKEADKLQNSIAETRRRQEEIENLGFWKNILRTAGLAFSAFFPGLAPIAIQVSAAVGTVLDIISDHFCSIM